MRLIDADVMIKDLQAMQRQFDAIAIDGMIRGIEKQPTIEAEPVRHGKWIVQDETYTRCFCSECKSGNHQGYEKFCPHCGAKMDLEE